MSHLCPFLLTPFKRWGLLLDKIWTIFHNLFSQNWGFMAKWVNKSKIWLSFCSPIARPLLAPGPVPAHGQPMIHLSYTHWPPIACPWPTCGPPVAHPWPTHGPPMAHPWPTHGPPLTHPEPPCGPHCPPADGTLLANSSATIWTCPRQIVVLDSLFVHTLS